MSYEGDRETSLKQKSGSRYKQSLADTKRWRYLETVDCGERGIKIPNRLIGGELTLEAGLSRRLEALSDGHVAVHVPIAEHR